MNDQTNSPAGSQRSDGSLTRASATILPFRQKASVGHLPDQVAQADTRNGVLSGLWRAISTDGVVNHYQPQYELDSGEIVAVEALVRLRGRDGTLVYPDHFIRQAEESGLIVPLGRAVIRSVCRDLAHWRAQGMCIERISINLSAHQVNIDHELPEFVHATVAGFGLQPSDLEFELTERQALMPDGPGVRCLRTLSSMGARLAIDDFGTGFSSVAYLADLPIDTVKFDRSMISRLAEDGSIQHMIRHLLQMAQALGLTTVGEGVETEEQGALLTGLGCELGQGYLVARPMDADAIRSFVSSRQQEQI